MKYNQEESAATHPGSVFASGGAFASWGGIVRVARFECIDLVLSVRGLMTFVFFSSYAFLLAKVLFLLNAESQGRFAQVVESARTLDPESQARLLGYLPGDWAQSLKALLLDGTWPPLAFVLLFLTIAVSFSVVVLLAYGRITEDFISGYTRYLFLRVDRTSYLLGKWLAVLGVGWLISIAVVLFVVCFGVATGQLDGALYDKIPALLVIVTTYLVADSALIILCSALAPTRFWALALPMVIVAGAGMLGIWVPVFKAIWMGSWTLGLWRLSPPAIAVYGANAVVFLGIAIFRVHRRWA